MDSVEGVVFKLTSVGSSATFTLATATDGCRPGSYTARIQTHALSAAADVALTRTRFAEFFASIARDWRGWQGVKSLQAHRPGVDYGGWVMSLRATSDQRGHVRLAVDLGDPWIDPEPSQYETHVGSPACDEPGAWVARVTLVLEAAQLDLIAGSASRLPH